MYSEKIPMCKHLSSIGRGFFGGLESIFICVKTEEGTQKSKSYSGGDFGADADGKHAFERSCIKDEALKIKLSVECCAPAVCDFASDVLMLKILVKNTDDAQRDITVGAKFKNPFLKPFCRCETFGKMQFGKMCAADAMSYEKDFAEIYVFFSGGQECGAKESGGMPVFSSAGNVLPKKEKSVILYIRAYEPNIMLADCGRNVLFAKEGLPLSKEEMALEAGDAKSFFSKCRKDGERGICGPAENTVLLSEKFVFEPQNRFKRETAAFNCSGESLLFTELFGCGEEGAKLYISEVLDALGCDKITDFLIENGQITEKPITAADSVLSIICACYGVYLKTQDMAWLSKNYDSVCMADEYIKSHWDKDELGVITGEHESVFTDELLLESGYTTSWYILSNLCMKNMSSILKKEYEAEKYDKMVRFGLEFMNRNLFDGKGYLLKFADGCNYGRIRGSILDCVVWYVSDKLGFSVFDDAYTAADAAYIKKRLKKGNKKLYCGIKSPKTYGFLNMCAHKALKNR